jgi:hypothetical protein
MLCECFANALRMLCECFANALRMLTEILVLQILLKHLQPTRLPLEDLLANESSLAAWASMADRTLLTVYIDRVLTGVD